MEILLTDEVNEEKVLLFCPRLKPKPLHVAIALSFNLRYL